MPEPVRAPAPDAAGRRERAAPRRGAARRIWARTGRFFKRVYEKGGEDDIFFLAGAIAFNVVVAIVPLILATLAIAGVVLRFYTTDPASRLEQIILDMLPPLGAQQRAVVGDWFDGLIAGASKVIGIGTVVFIWLATRLIGTLRSALRHVFDVHRDRGIIAGKIFDARMVVVAGLLFAVNVTLTVGLQIVAKAGFNVLGVLGAAEGQISFFQLLWTRAVALFFLWMTFVLVYRYLPARRTSWRTSLTAATFTALFTEVLKEAFSWYVASVADYGSTYGNLATLMILVLWIYYTSVVFVLGGEIAQVSAMQRIRRRQKERLR